jgi:hypothetical protein
MQANRDSLSQKITTGIHGENATAIDTAGRRSPGVRPVDSPAGKNAMNKLLNRFLRWLYPEQRKARRHSYPPIVSYLGAVHTTRPYPVADVSASGFFMVTPERWLPGTEMPVTLERTDIGGAGFGKSITLLSTVVRTGPSGVGFSIAVVESKEGGAETSKSENGSALGGHWATRGDLEKFLDGLKLEEYEVAELERAS